MRQTNQRVRAWAEAVWFELIREQLERRDVMLLAEASVGGHDLTWAPAGELEALAHAVNLEEHPDDGHGRPVLR